MKKLMALALTLILALGCLGAFAEETTEIYFLNFKPEIAEVYEEIAATYEAETGVHVNVVTAAAGTYEQTLRSEIAKADAPTIFQINGPVGLQSWKDYCLDLADTEFYNMLSDKTLAVTEGDAVYGIPYVVEGYGIIYNDAIMDKYFASENKSTEYTSMDEIKGFEALKAVVEDMTALKDELGIQGVFASTSMAAGEQWRWQTHLLNMPIYYEFKDAGGENTILTGLDAAEITFSYNENFKNLFDLYTNNSVTAKGLLSNKTTNDSMAEFALGSAPWCRTATGAPARSSAWRATWSPTTTSSSCPSTPASRARRPRACASARRTTCASTPRSPKKSSRPPSISWSGCSAPRPARPM